MAPSQPTLEPPFKARVQSCCPTFHTILEPGLQPRANQREASCGWPGPAATCRLTQLLLGQESLHLHRGTAGPQRGSKDLSWRVLTLSCPRASSSQIGLDLSAEASC